MKLLQIEVILTGCDDAAMTREILVASAGRAKAELLKSLQGLDYSVDKVSIEIDSSNARWGGRVVIYSGASEAEIRRQIGAERIVGILQDALKPAYEQVYKSTAFELGEVSFKQLGQEHRTNVERLCSALARKYWDELSKGFSEALPISPEVNPEDLFRLSMYQTDGERRMLFYGACYAARERGGDAVTMADLELALTELQLAKKGDIVDKGSYIERLSRQFSPVEAACSFDRLVITEKARQEIELALITINPDTNSKYEEWGLLKLDGHPRSVLNFYGPPGTGKTMAAHAIAQRFNKKIIIASCHSLQSKWHGESAKNVKAVFYAAEQHDAILFFDEADSLISQRLEEVHSGSEDEINNMRNTILTCLEEHTGIVIFASNFVKRYDFAFETRIQSVLFPMPDVEMLEKIWQAHLPSELPGVTGIDCRKVAEETSSLDFCGRDVKNAVLRACKVAIANGKDSIAQEDILSACKYIYDSRTELKANKDVIQKRKEKDNSTVETLENLTKKHVDGIFDRFFADIPLADNFDRFKIAHELLYFGEKEIRQIVSDACFEANVEKSLTLTTEHVESAILRYRPRKEQEEAYDTLLEAVQAVIDRKACQKN